MEKINQTRVTVRLDDEATSNLQELISQTGENQSKIINDLLKRKDLIKVIDGRRIASELHELRVILKNGKQEEVSKLCSVLIEEIYKRFQGDGV